MIDRRRMVGNDIRSGNMSLRHLRRQADALLGDKVDILQLRRERLIALTAKPPSIPTLPKTPAFNQFAYGVLLIAILAAVAVTTPFINWAFMIYAALAVITRLPSTQVFLSALVCLVVTPLATILQKQSIADTFAVMIFYFLLIGLIRAALELRRESRTVNKAKP